MPLKKEEHRGFKVQRGFSFWSFSDPKQTQYHEESQLHSQDFLRKRFRATSLGKENQSRLLVCSWVGSKGKT